MTGMISLPQLCAILGRLRADGLISDADDMVIVMSVEAYLQEAPDGVPDQLPPEWRRFRAWLIALAVLVLVALIVLAYLYGRSASA